MKQELLRLDLNGVNCYLIKSEEGFVLFDTGGPLTMDKVYTDRREELEEQLERAGCKPGNLKAIVITHGDLDHVFNAAFLRDKYQTVIAMHPEDVNLVENLTVDKLMDSFHYHSIILRLAFFFLRKMLRRISEKQYNAFVKFSPDILIKEGDDLAPYGIDAKVMHLPGHTNGSIGIITQAGELICGDTFTNMKKPGPAMNASDFKQLKNSIRKLKSKTITRIYPGHGEPFQAAGIKLSSV